MRQADKAHQNVTSQFQSGLISLEEAKISHRKIDEYANSDKSTEQKAALIAIWGNL